MKLRLASLDDVGFLLVLRNDPVARSMSRVNTAEVTREEYVRWLVDALASTVRRLYIASDDGEDVGLIRTDLDGEALELSWNVHPDMRQRGIGARMVQATVEIFRGQLTARVRPTNAASLRIAELAGFTRTGEHDGFVHFVRHGSR